MLNQLEKLKSIKAETVSNSASVKFSVVSDKLNFPLMIKPVHSGLDLNNWVNDHRKEFQEKMNQYGAVLFRGFEIDTVEKFQSLTSLFIEKPLEYKLRSSPRFSVGGNVYHTTTYPEEYSINMHSESSYDPNHPNNIAFCCIKPADEMGETPIADNRLVIKNLSDKTRTKFLEKGVKYVRNLNNKFGLSWKEVFQTEDKKEVNTICKESGIENTWISDDKLTLTWVKKAIWEHPITNDQVWFNHAFFFNKYALEEDFLCLIESDDQLPNNTFYGDGTEISEEEIEEIRVAYEKSKVEFSWVKGDVLFLDNMLTSHGRNPFKGDRKIIASIF
jgi:alpha-ketoglutarate-dependent taurine dioxygenase